MLVVLSVLTFVLSYFCIYLFIKKAKSMGFINQPNERSMHRRPKARGAGTCFVGAALAVLSVALFLGQYSLNNNYFILLAVLIVFVAGFLDDLKDISPKLKFALIISSTLILAYNGFYIKTMGSYMGYEIALPFYIGIPLTLFAVTGFTNAMNLTDGLDGLAGMISMIMLFVFFWIGYVHHDPLLVIVSIVFMAAVGAFLLFNWYPAKVFMGDSGSLTLGFVISVLGIRSLEYVQPMAMLFIVVLPVLDTFIVMTRRIQRGLSPFKADKTHMHHILYNRYEDVPYTVIMLIYIQIAFTIIGVQLRGADNFMSLILFGILFFIFLNLFDQRMKHRKNRNKGIIEDWGYDFRRGRSDAKDGHQDAESGQ